MTTFNGVQVSPTDASEVEERNSSVSGSDAENDDPGTVETLDENGNPSKKRKRSLKIS